VVSKTSQILRKLAKAPAEVRVREDNILLVNGQPFFPIGMYLPLSEPICKELSQAGFNLVLTGNVLSGSANRYRLLDLADRYHLKVVEWKYVNIKKNILPGNPEYLQKERERIPSLANHPAFLGCFLDELLWCGVDYQSVKPYYELLREQDPYHFLWLNHAPRNTVQEIAHHNQSTDITGSDIYPAPEERNLSRAHSNLPNKTLSVVGDETRKLIETVEGKKPVWMILQGFGWNDLFQKKDEESKRLGRRPNFPESRFMTYDAIVNGATGVLYFGCTYIEYDSQLWKDLKKIAAELNRLHPVLVAKSSEDTVKAYSESIKSKLLQKEYEGQQYIIAVNEAKTAGNVEFKGRNLKGIDKVKVLFEGRDIKVKDSEFQDYFPGYGVHIYTTSDKELEKRQEIVKAQTPVRETESLKSLDWEKLRRGILSYQWQANWIWYPQGEPAKGVPTRQSIYGRKKVIAKSSIKEAFVVITADNFYKLFLNNQLVGEDAQGEKGGLNTVEAYDIKPYLKEGKNLVTFWAQNEEGPAGILLEGKITYSDGQKDVFLSNDSWVISLTKQPSWQEIEFDDSKWAKAKLLGVPPARPWGKRMHLELLQE